MLVLWIKKFDFRSSTLLLEELLQEFDEVSLLRVLWIGLHLFGFQVELVSYVLTHRNKKLMEARLVAQIPVEDTAIEYFSLNSKL